LNTWPKFARPKHLSLRQDTELEQEAESVAKNGQIYREVPYFLI